MNDYTLLKDWQDYMLAQGRSPETLRKYRYALHRLASEVSPPKPYVDISETDVVVFLASLGGKAHSKQLYIMAFRSFYRWASDHGHVEADPTEHLHPKAPSERPADAFSAEEVGALMVSARRHRGGERHALAIQLCYALGARRSELCSITADDIDWSGRRVMLRHTKGDKPRWVEMNDIAADALERLRPWYNGTVLGSMDPNWFTMVVNRAAKGAGFPPGRRNAHMLRAAFATELLAAGVPIQVASRLLGHARISTTGRYLACRDKDKRDAVIRLPAPGGFTPAS